MRPGDGNRHVSETLARLVEEQLVAAMWRLELRLYMLFAAAICASLAAHLFMLGQLQLSLDRAQREQRRARRRLQSAGADVLEGSSSLPEHEPSAPSCARRRHLPTCRASSESDLDARPGTRLLQRWTNETSNEQTRSAPETGVDARPGTSLLQRPHEASATSGPLHKQVYTQASSASSKSHSPSSREPSLRSPSRPSRSQAQDRCNNRPVKHDASRRGSPDKPRRTDLQPRWPGDAAPPPSGPPESPQPMAGVVQPVRDSFKRRVTSGSERQAENQRGLSLEDPLPPFKDILKRFFETQSQPTLSSQASGPAAMQMRPRRAATEPALWTVREGASEGGDGTDRGQQIAGDGGSGDGLNSDQQFGVSGQASELELIQTLQSMREMLRQKLE